MLKGITNLITEQKHRIETLEKEVEKLKKRLQHRHTEISDLRYSKTLLHKANFKLMKEIEARQSE